MALVVKEYSLEATSGGTENERTAKRYFRVWDDGGANITPVQAETASGIPDAGDGHPDDSGRIVIGIDAEHVEKQLRYACNVTVSYSSAVGELASSPLSDPHIWSIDSEVSEEEYFVDKTPTTPKKALLTNNKPISPRPKRDVVAYKLVIKKNVSDTYSLSNFTAYNNKVNLDSVTYAGETFAAGSVKVIMQLGEVQERFSVKYRVLTLNLSIRDGGHQQTFDSRDKEELVSGNLKPITDQYGREVDYAYPLASNGTKKSESTDDPAIISLKRYEEVNLNTFVNA